MRKHLILADQSTCVGSNISSTESNTNIRIGNEWAAINCLSTIRISYLSNKIKHQFYLHVTVSLLSYDCTTWTLTKRLDKNLHWNNTRVLCTVLNKSWKLQHTHIRTPKKGWRKSFVASAWFQGGVPLSIACFAGLNSWHGNGGARVVRVIVVRNGHSSNPERVGLHFT